MGFKNIFYPLKSVQENLVFGSAVASYIVVYFAYESLYLTVLFIKTLQWLYIFNFRKLRVGQNIFFSTYHCFSEVIKGCLAETEKKKEKYCYLNKRNISNK